jgi:hypothetical protein
LINLIEIGYDGVWVSQQRRALMPQILVVADGEADIAGRVVYRERISASDLESAHFSGQLVERVGWAVRDANVVEYEEPRGLARSLRQAAPPAGEAVHPR